MQANNMNSLLHSLTCTIYVFLLLWTKIIVSVEVQCIERERLALLELKQGFVDSYDRLSTWGDGEHQKECCNWTGVHCSDNTNHVVVLDLHNTPDDDYFLRLKPLGSIVVAESLSKLDHLTYLDLSHNDFHGNEIPKSIGSLFHLRYLNLSFSGFGGTIPQQLGNLSKLKYLDFRHNDLVGVIPNSLGNLSILEYLDLAWNSENLKSNLEWLNDLASLQILSLGGVDLGTAKTWPKLVTNNMTHLKKMSLSLCKLVGNIPEQLGALSQLQQLHLSHNSITGLIPHQLGNLSKLQYLDLHSNKLHGYIPNQLGNLSCLQELYLYGNQLGGIIPDTFGSLSSLTELSLSGNHFNGRLPNALLDLCHLRFLGLSGNNFDERLDDFLHFTMGRTPRCLYQSLQDLYLSFNQLTGSIPDLSFFVELQVLYLRYNKLNGTLSEGIGQLSNLVGLSIASNPLQGTITENHFSILSKLTHLEMSNITSLSFNISKSWVPPFQLEVLELDYCKIGPYFPMWLENQRSIQIMSMQLCGIVDVLPDWFWRGTGTLGYLDLSHNKIQGEMGNLTVHFSNSPHIDLSANQLRGEIPPFLFQAGALNLSTNMFSGSMFPLCLMTHSSSLGVLDISHNQLSEELPADCFRFQELIYLDLSFNNFSGEIPASLLSLPNLHALHLQNNKFRSIPLLCSGNLTSLRSMDLSENEISASIPSWIGAELVNLNVLSLRNNKFYGSLPFNICNLTQILVFDLSANNLSGSIPKCFNEFIVLSNSSNFDVDLSYNYIKATSDEIYNDSMTFTWKGGLTEYKTILKFQRMIDLSNNQLNGEIPDEIMDLVQLHSLNLSFNKLGGEINPKLGRLQNLESLDLSRNLLYGPIPPSIAQLRFLDKLDLSFNNLSGKIPIGSQLQTLNGDSYAGNPELCGPPLGICQNDRTDNEKSNIIDEGENENEDLFEIYGFYIFMAVGFIVGFWTSCSSLIFIKSWRDIFYNLCTRICDNVYVKVKILVNKLSRRLEA